MSPLLKRHLAVNTKIFFAHTVQKNCSGDKTKRLSDIVKITSGCNETCSVWVDDFYKS